MILAFHAIFSAYGFWLPNDPRGSWSDFVRKWDLVKHGRATKTNAHFAWASVPHDRQHRLDAKADLDYPPVVFSDQQICIIARGFNNAITDAQYQVHACAIMPDHVHIVIGRHPRKIGQIIGHLKGKPPCS